MKLKLSQSIPLSLNFETCAGIDGFLKLGHISNSSFYKMHKEQITELGCMSDS